MDKYEAVKHLIEQGKDATLEDGVVMLRSRATGAALDREYKAMKKDLKAAGYNGSLGIRGVRRDAGSKKKQPEHKPEPQQPQRITKHPGRSKRRPKGQTGRKHPKGKRED